ncbi:MAG: DUF1376 domain-containing protein [Pseudomonadota bacterium]
MTPKRGIVRIDWYADDFLGGVSFLTPEERGVYITLISQIYLRGGAVPDEDMPLSRACNMSVRAYRRVKQSLIDHDKIQIENGLLSQHRALKELAAAHARIEAYAERERRRKARRSAQSNADDRPDQAPKLDEKIQENQSNEPDRSNSHSQQAMASPNGEGHKPGCENPKSDLAAEPVAPARESGGGSGSCSGAVRPLRVRVGDEGYRLFQDLRAELMRHGRFSSADCDAIKLAIESHSEGVFVLREYPLDPKRWDGVTEVALAEGLSFEVRTKPTLKAIEGGKS